MKVLLLVLKLLFLVILLLFLVAGLDMFFTEPNAKEAGKVLIALSSALIMLFSYFAFFRKNNKQTDEAKAVRDAKRKNFNEKIDNSLATAIAKLDSWQAKGEAHLEHSNSKEKAQARQQKLLAEKAKLEEKLEQERERLKAEKEFKHSTKTVINKDTPHKFAFKMIDSKAIIWEGTLSGVTFTYYTTNQEKLRLTVDLKQIFVDKSENYFLVIKSNENKETIEEKQICTALVYKSSRYRLLSLMTGVLKLGDFNLNYYISKIKGDVIGFKQVKEITPIKTRFSYTHVKKEKDIIQGYYEIIIDQYLEIENGINCLSGLDPKSNKRYFFQRGYIATMLKSDGHKKYWFDDWLKNVAGIDIHVNH